jgi:hypothetical protein
MLWVVPKRAAQLGDGLIYRSRRDNDAGPDFVEQLLQFDRATRVPGETEQQTHCKRLESHRAPVARDLIERWIDPPLTDAQNRRVLGCCRHDA